MHENDLQIGYTWTRPDARGRGLATLMLRRICMQLGGRGRRLWYLVEADNAASIRVAEKAGFTLVGAGAKVPRAGVMAFGYYRMD